MRITVKSSCDPTEKEIGVRSSSLGDLFEELSGDLKPAGFVFFDRKQGGVLPDCEVMINGRQYAALVDGLDSDIHDGDKFEIYILLVPGG